ncbi:hypothetical protein [Nocardia terpenica]|uniref:Uncharacterized protein n=1 Tax=Nocardia terpenica TaxID=455432 RepID=A0A6G9Z7Y2_9NOCA|nr:hypothetical protein [Nocardia terpenica]QIS21276.1 hypothetical protein F6W96_26065 [Nocardia terpenica]
MSKRDKLDEALEDLAKILAGPDVSMDAAVHAAAMSMVANEIRELRHAVNGVSEAVTYTNL